MTIDLLAGVRAGLAVAVPIGAIGSSLVGLAARERLGVAGLAVRVATPMTVLAAVVVRAVAVLIRA